MFTIDEEVGATFWLVDAVPCKNDLQPVHGGKFGGSVRFSIFAEEHQSSDAAWAFTFIPPGCEGEMQSSFELCT